MMMMMMMMMMMTTICDDDEDADHPDDFGSRYLHEQTGYRITAHNRMWAPDAVYARENGGDYDFHLETTIAIPLERRFWDDLLRNASDWGMYTYEQDWLYDEFVGACVSMTGCTTSLWVRACR
jgi:hypothetical protein